MSIRYDDKFVKTPQMEIEYTPEMVSDLVKCSEDILYFLNFVTIVTIDGGRKKLGDLLYPFQKEMIKMCKDNRYLCFLFCRQSGKCVSYNTKIKIRDKKTRKIEEVIIGDFYKKCNFSTVELDNDDKFLELKHFMEYEVFTPSGWKHFRGIGKTKKFPEYEITLENGTILNCADTHIVYKDNKEIFVKDLKNKDFIQTEEGIKEVSNVRYLGNWVEMYDCLDVDGSIYYTNGIKSHNSTTVGAFALWYAIFNSDKFIGIASNKASSAKDLLRRIKIMYEELPFYLKPGVVEYNKNSIEFENGSKIETAGTTEDTFRGRSIALLLADETAFVSDGIAREFYTSIYPSVSSSDEAKIIIISTPNGVFNLFHEIYSGAEEGRNEYKCMKVTWDMIPGRTAEWKAKQIKNMGNEQKFLQEFEVNFLGSNNTVVSADAIGFINTTIDDNYHSDLGGRLRIFENPIDGAKYIMGIDPSKGTGEHDACIQIYRLESFKPIKLINAATFQSNTTDTYELSSIINKLSIYYNEALIAVENNGEGSSVSQNLWWTFENPNLYNSGNKENEIGIRATKSTKPKAVITMKKLIEDGSLIIKDRETAKQLSGFIEKKNGTFECTLGGDDLVSALYWMCFLITTENFEDVIDLFKNKDNEDEEDVWGILADISNDHYIENSDWSWMNG